LYLSELASLEITRGADLCRQVDFCGGTMQSELVFHGDTVVAVGRARDEEFEYQGHTYGVRNSGGGYLLPSTCTDLEFVSTWAIWRKVP
jgi:hypothetical protein